jgi:hypothetical protein
MLNVQYRYGGLLQFLVCEIKSIVYLLENTDNIYIIYTCIQNRY